MPLYEYVCETCDTHWEDIVPYEQADRQQCSVCKTLAVRKISLTAPAVWKCPIGTASDPRNKE